MNRTLAVLNFEQDFARTMRRALHKGWIKAPPPSAPCEVARPACKDYVRISRNPISRALWQAAMSIAEPFTISALLAGARIPGPPSVARNWVNQRRIRRELLTVGEQRSGRCNKTGQAIINTLYRRAENFAEMAAIALQLNHAHTP